MATEQDRADAEEVELMEWAADLAESRHTCFSDALPESSCCSAELSGYWFDTKMCPTCKDHCGLVSTCAECGETITEEW